MFGLKFNPIGCKLFILFILHLYLSFQLFGSDFFLRRYQVIIFFTKTNYSHSLFSSQQMPEEGRLFSTVDRNYKDVMRHLDKDQHVCTS